MAINSFYVVGSQQRTQTLNINQWNQHEKAVIMKVDISRKTVCQQIEYETPEKFRPEIRNPAMVFKSGSLKDNLLHVCTQTEVLSYSLPDLTINNHLSLPCFNDVHHVIATDHGTLLIVVTGLDLIVEVTPEGKVVQEWNVVDEDTWARFSRDEDYRKIESTKPHMAHPNHVFYLDDEIWVTRFEQKDAICLTSLGKRIDIGVERPHDGYVLNGKVYFTTVDGHIVIADACTHQQLRVINLRDMTDTELVLGWCRGLAVIDDEYILVGFSRIRPTKLHANLLWMKGQISGKKHVELMPARVALYNIGANELCWEFNVEEYKMGAIFSVHIAD